MSNSSSDNRVNTDDRLSDLEEDVILYILSFQKTKQAVQTCVLSRRYKDLWKRIPNLVLHSADFGSIKIFTNFVSKIVTLRDSSVGLNALDFDRNGLVEPHLLKRIVNYAISHHVHRLRLSVQCEIIQIPPSIFSSRILTHLNLAVYPRLNRKDKTLFPNFFDLQALTSLNLENFVFIAANDNDPHVEPFSVFKRLDSLFLSCCDVKKTPTLCISSATLLNFTMQIETYADNSYRTELRTPSLATFTFVGNPCEIVSDLSDVKHVDINAQMMALELKPSLFLFNWLLQLHNARSLTVTARTLRVLRLIPNLLGMEFLSLGNLKSLKVKRKSRIYGPALPLIEDEPPIANDIIGFLLQNSPLAQLQIID